MWSNVLSGAIIALVVLLVYNMTPIKDWPFYQALIACVAVGVVIGLVWGGIARSVNKSGAGNR